MALAWPRDWNGAIASQFRLDLAYAPEVAAARVDRVLLYPAKDAYRNGSRARAKAGP